MPAVAKTSDGAVVGAARKLVARDGHEALSMQAVAAAVAVKAPSLYKRFDGRDALLRAVQREAFDDLRAALDRVPTSGPARARLAALAVAYRAFARKNPRLYAAMFADVDDLGENDLAARRAAALPLLTALGAVAPEAARLDVARALTAFLHGFVSMELSRSFRLGGDPQPAFARGFDALVAGLGL